MAQEKAKLLALAADRRAAKASGKEDGPVSDSMMEDSPKKRKKVAKKAALDAQVFLKHQEARLSASEYLIDRAQSCKLVLEKESNSKWLLNRAIQAKLKCDEIEDEARMAAALEEAEGQTKQAAARAMSAELSGALKFKSKLKSKLKGKLGKVRSSEVSVDTTESDSVTSASVAEEPSAADTSVGAGGPPKEEVEEDAPLYVKPKKVTLTRYPAFVKPAVKRTRVGKIEMHHKPTLSHMQKERLRRPLDISELPPSAFGSAEGLLAALRGHYNGPNQYEELHPQPTGDAAPLEEPSVAWPGGGSQYDWDPLIPEGSASAENSTVASAAELGNLDESLGLDLGDAASVPADAPTVTPRRDAAPETESDPATAAPVGSVDPDTAMDMDELANQLAVLPIDGPPPILGPASGPILPADGSMATFGFRLSKRDVVAEEGMPPLPVDHADIASLMTSNNGLTSVSVILDPKEQRFRKIQKAQVKRIQQNAGSGKREFAANPFEPVRVPNNLSFLDAPGATVDSASCAKDGVNAFKSVGYVDGATPYASHWRAKLNNCLELYDNGNTLRKSICSVLKLSAQPLTMLEAFCALADCDGSQIEALGRLADPEFLREVKTVCAMLPVTQIICRLDGILDFNSVEQSAFEAGGQLGKAVDRPNAQHMRSVSDEVELRSLQHRNSQTPTLFESRHKLAKPPPEALHTGSGGQLRVHTHAAQRLLPHLDMLQGSPITRSRSTMVTLARDAPSGQATQYVSAYDGLTGVYPSGAGGDGNGGFGVLPLNAQLNAPASAGMSGSPQSQKSPIKGQGLSLSIDVTPVDAAPIRSSSPLSFNGTRKSSPKTTGNKSYGNSSGFGNSGNNKKFGKFNQRGSDSVSSLGAGSARPGLAVQARSKTSRLDSVIDEIFQQTDNKMLVMCRRDAIRAAGEEVLSRSGINEFKAVAYRRSNGMLLKQAASGANSISKSLGSLQDYGMIEEEHHIHSHITSHNTSHMSQEELTSMGVGVKQEHGHHLHRHGVMIDSVTGSELHY